MANLATKAPNITPEVARDYQRRATQSRMARIKREKEASEAMRLALDDALARKPDNDDARKQRVLRQIDDYLDDMKGASLKTRLMIGKAVAELWKLVQPTAGVLKNRGSSRQQPSATPIETPQEPTP